VSLRTRNWGRREVAPVTGHFAHGLW
jgi:hypothetical protein